MPIRERQDSTSSGWGLVIAISLAVALLAGRVYSAETANILASGTIPDSRAFHGPVTLSVRVLTLSPGDKLPWHYHPGSAFNVVKSGIETVEDGCGSQKTLTSGQGFEVLDGRVHRGRNLSDKDVVVYDTFLIPEGKPTTVTFADDNPHCGPPQDLDECSNNGWRQFDHPQRFTDEQQCRGFVRRLLGNRLQFQRVP